MTNYADCKEFLESLRSAKEELFYVIKFENGTKFGITSDPINRFRAYTSPWCYPIESLHITYGKIENTNRDIAKWLENRCKSEFLESRANSKEFTIMRPEEIMYSAIRFAKGINTSIEFKDLTAFLVTY